MSDQHQGHALTTTDDQPARAVRAYTPVEDVIPMFDTAMFEHMSRVASLMAKSGLVPVTLQGEGERGWEQTMANCFMVVNQARIWNMDPFSVSQCAAVVYGKLCWEGKLIAAVLETKLGLRLKFKWNNEPVGSDKYGIEVSGRRDGDDEAVSITGTVGDWKTFEKNGNVKGNWKGASSQRQLAYRGTREWARLYAPAVMLGVITQDEIDDARERAALQAASPPRGLSDAHGSGQGESRPQLAAPAPAAASTAARTVVDPPHNPDTGEIASDGDQGQTDLQGDASGEALPPAGGGQEQEQQPPADAPAKRTRKPRAEKPNSTLPIAANTGGAVRDVSLAPRTDAPAEAPSIAGKPYTLLNDRQDAKGNRAVYVDGKRTAMIGAESPHPVYDGHPTAGGKPVTAAPGESTPAPAPPAPATASSFEAGIDEDNGLTEDEDVQDEDAADETPAAAQDDGAPNEAVQMFEAALATATAWPPIQTAMFALKKHAAFPGEDAPAYGQCKTAAWKRVLELQASTTGDIRDGVDQAKNPFVFDLFAFHTPDVDDLDQTWRSLIRSKGYQALNDKQKDVIASRYSIARTALVNPE